MSEVSSSSPGDPPILLPRVPEDQHIVDFRIRGQAARLVIYGSVRRKEQGMRVMMEPIDNNQHLAEQTPHSHEATEKSCASKDIITRMDVLHTSDPLQLALYVHLANPGEITTDVRETAREKLSQMMKYNLVSPDQRRELHGLY